MEEEKQQSQSWEKYKDYNSKERISGFPFNEGFPKMYGGKIYDLIDVNGERHKARVDDSREFMSEGLEWKIIGRPNIERWCVVAWKESENQ